MKTIKIVSKGPNSSGMVVTQDGVEIEGISKIEIFEIKPCSQIQAKLTVWAELDVEAELIEK